MAPAVFRNKVGRAEYEIRDVLWRIDEIEDAAGSGDERCKKFVSENASDIRAMRACADSWRDDATRIAAEVEASTAKREGKVFCDVCHKNVKNMPDHRRRSSSHKGRVRVKELDNDPNWERVSQDAKHVVEVILSAPAPSSTADKSEYQWTGPQRMEHQRALNDRLESVSDIVLLQNYAYHSSENRWGRSGGKLWVSPHINKHAHHLTLIIEGIREAKNPNTSSHHQSRHDRGRSICHEFRRIVDPIIRNPNALSRHAAMYALQLNRED